MCRTICDNCDSHFYTLLTRLSATRRFQKQNKTSKTRKNNQLLSQIKPNCFLMSILVLLCFLKTRSVPYPGRHRSLPIQWGKGIVSPSGATGVFRAATSVAAAPQRGANPSFATGDERGAFLKCLVVGFFYRPVCRRFLLRLRNMLFLFQPRLLALLIFLAVSFEIVVGHDVIRADG